MSAPTVPNPQIGTPAPGVPLTPPVQWTTSAEHVSSRTKLYAILGGIAALVILILIIAGLYSLGGEDQSALERLTDISIIFIVLLSSIMVVFLAGITAALIFLILQIKDRVIPTLEEVNDTAKRVRGTTDFMTEEAVKPILNVASSYARMRAMSRAVLFGKAGKAGKAGKPR